MCLQSCSWRISLQRHKLERSMTSYSPNSVLWIHHEFEGGVRCIFVYMYILTCTWPLALRKYNSSIPNTEKLGACPRLHDANGRKMAKKLRGDFRRPYATLVSSSSSASTTVYQQFLILPFHPMIQIDQRSWSRLPTELRCLRNGWAWLRAVPPMLSTVWGAADERGGFSNAQATAASGKISSSYMIPWYYFLKFEFTSFKKFWNKIVDVNKICVYSL
jgi:hypothetical protein